MRSPKHRSDIEDIKLIFILQPVSVFTKQKLGFTTNKLLSSNFQQTNKENIMDKKLM